MEKVLTSKRLEFLKTLPNHHPESVRALTAPIGWHVKTWWKLLASSSYETLMVEVHL